MATGFVDGTGKVRCVTPVARTPLNTDFARRRFSIAYRTFDRLVRSWVCVPHVRPPRSFLGVRPPSSHPLGLWIRHRRRPRHRRGRHHGRPPAIVGACTEAGLRRDLDSLWGRASSCPRHEHRARHRPHRQIRYLQHGNSWAPTSSYLLSTLTCPPAGSVFQETMGGTERTKRESMRRREGQWLSC